MKIIIGIVLFVLALKGAMWMGQYLARKTSNEFDSHGFGNGDDETDYEESNQNSK